MSLRIASYNIHKGVSAFGRRARIHGIKQAIDLLEADLIFLQEVQGQHDYHAEIHTRWPDLGHHDFIAGESHHAVYGMNAVYEHGHHGNALLSRFPILSSVNYDVSDHALEQRGILHAVIDLDGRQVHCFVIHLGLFAVSRRRQVQTLIAEIKNSLSDDTPLIIAGDFNDWNKSLSRMLYEQLHVTEAFDTPGLKQPRYSGFLKTWFGTSKFRHARTFPASLPCLCLDRVYLRGFELIHAEVLNGAPWNALSDHIPILIELNLLPLQSPLASSA